MARPLAFELCHCRRRIFSNAESESALRFIFWRARGGSAAAAADTHTAKEKALHGDTAHTVLLRMPNCRSIYLCPPCPPASSVRATAREGAHIFECGRGRDRTGQPPDELRHSIYLLCGLRFTITKAINKNKCKQTRSREAKKPGTHSSLSPASLHVARRVEVLEAHH